MTYNREIVNAAIYDAYRQRVTQIYPDWGIEDVEHLVGTLVLPPDWFVDEILAATTGTPEERLRLAAMRIIPTPPMFEKKPSTMTEAALEHDEYMAELRTKALALVMELP